MIDQNNNAKMTGPREFYRKKSELYVQACADLGRTIEKLRSLWLLEGSAPGCDDQEVRDISRCMADLERVRATVVAMADPAIAMEAMTS